MTNKSSSVFCSDFTEEHYKQLLKLAKLKYKFRFFDTPIPKEDSILWRHDCDLSLNRALKLAQIEAEEGIKSTFFINPHCEFYNLLEKKQSRIIDEISRLGHQIGLHFDANYYQTESESDLEHQLQLEISTLKNYFNFEVRAFSFHDPIKFHLSCEKDSYFGLVNCYSKYLKDNVKYVSDSNGYWRYDRLFDVLNTGNFRHLHILTHPGWWQKEVLPPRSRIIKCAQGRSDNLLKNYDNALLSHNRENLAK